MRPKPVPAPAAGETDMFRNRLETMIDMRHEFVRLARLIDWRRFAEAAGDTTPRMAGQACRRG